jgi:hypothetical protein
MSSADEKRRRKELLQQARVRQREQSRAGMPLSRGQLAGLIDHLDEALADGCDHTLRRTRAYLAAHALDEETVVAWLAEHGGYCDCEVLANVEDRLDL